jgi:drug/metabolite transporter (DMT)-like permease
MSAVVAATNVIAKRTPRGDPWAFNAVAMGAGCFVLLAFALLAGERLALPTQGAPTAALVYLVLGSIPLFGLYLYVLQRWTASGVAYQFVLMPLVTIAAASYLAREPITLGLLAGAALVAVGVYIGALGRSAPKPAPPSKPVEESAASEDLA